MFEEICRMLIVSKVETWKHKHLRNQKERKKSKRKKKLKKTGYERSNWFWTVRQRALTQYTCKWDWTFEIFCDGYCIYVGEHRSLFTHKHSHQNILKYPLMKTTNF